MDKLKELQDVIDHSQNIVFLVEQVSLQSPIFLTFVAQMGSIVSPWVGILRLSNWSLIPCLSAAQRTFSTSIRNTCSIPMPSPMRPIVILAWLEQTGKLKAVVTQKY